MRGHGHDRAGAVCDQHVVGDPDRDLLSVHRVDREAARRDPGLVPLGGHALDLRLLARLLDVLAHSRPMLFGRDLLDERVLRRENHERRAEQRVGSRRVDAHHLVGKPVDREIDLGAHAPPDPVGLHDADLLRPLVEQRQIIEQPVGVIRDLQEPLLEVALLDLDVGMPPAPPVDDLLVGQHGLVDRAPVDRRHRAVGKPSFQHQQEQPLRPPVVVGLAGGDLAVPVVEDPRHLQLALALRDVFDRPCPRVQSAALHRRVLGRQSKRVPAKRMQHLEALHALHAREHVAHHVVAQMTDRQVARRIGVHHEVVELRLRRAVGRLHDPALDPDLLPLGLDLLRYVRATAGTARHGPQILGMRVRDPRSQPGPAPPRPPEAGRAAGPPAPPQRPAPTPARRPGSAPCGPG